jgi:hypothetical protein
MLPRKAREVLTALSRIIESAGLVADEARPRAAAHESGHALVAWSSIHVSKVTGARLRGSGDGTVHYDIRSDTYLHSVAWDATAIGLAGLAGEIAAFGTVRSGDAEDDLVKARADVERIVAGGWARPWAAVPGVGLDIGAMFASPPSPAVSTVLRECYLRARAVILQRPDLFTLLQRELLERGEIDAVGIERLLGPRPWAAFR